MMRTDNSSESFRRAYHSTLEVGLGLGFLVMLAMTLRFSLYPAHRIIEGDGVHYAALARLISHDGDFSGAANPYWSNLWPAVIAFFDAFLFHDIDVAGRVASTFFGSLIVIPVYLLSHELLDNKRTGTNLVAAALVVGQPFLLRFSVLLFTESFYTFIIAMVLWLGIRLVKLPADQGRWMWFGLTIGLGLLTRPEIMAFATLFPLMALICGFRGRLFWRRILAGVFIYCIMLVLFLSFRTALIWHYFGTWQFGFGEKATINLILGDAFYNWGEVERLVNKFENGQFVNLRTSSESILSLLWQNRERLIERIGINVVHIAESYYRVLPSARGNLGLVIFSTTLAGLGAGWAWREKQTRWTVLLLMLVCAAYSTPWLFFFVQDRFVAPLTIIAILFTASGLIALETAALYAFRRHSVVVWPWLSLAIVCVFTIGTVVWAQSDLGFVWENDPVVQKEAGLYLKSNFPQSTKIMTYGPHVPYYFYDGNPYVRSIQNIPWAPYADLMAYVRKQNVDVIVVPEWLLLIGDFPTKDLAIEDTTHDGLEFLVIVGENKPNRIWIYKVLR